MESSLQLAKTTYENAMLISVQEMTPTFLNIENATRTFKPPNGQAKLEFTTGLTKASRGTHDEFLEARLWLWPHAPPEHALELYLICHFGNYGDA
jgi:hypothetical protein